MDFATIAGSDYLMITSRDGKSVYFYAAGTDTVFGRIILVGAIISLIFAVVLTVLLIVLLRGYNEETYREWEVLRAKERERIKQRYAQRGDKRGRAEDVEGKTAILRKLRALIGWNQISAKESLLKLEELLKRELPEIGSRNSKIKKGPILLGVMGLSGTMYTPLLKLAIEVMIDQKDEGAVTTYLYREIRLLCEREGIELL